VVTSEAVLDSDVLVIDDRVAMVGSALPAPEGTAVVDCRGCLLLPGGVDAHTHLDTPMMGTKTADDYESGTAAALCGGTTTIVDFAIQPAGQTLPQALETWHAKASGKARIDYGFHVAVSRLYPGIESDLHDVAVDGVTSIKIYMAYRGALMLDDGEMLTILRGAAAAGAQVAVHAENGDVIDRLAADLVAANKTQPRYHELARPPEAEVEAVERAIRISRIADAPIYFVHLSTEGATEAVARAKAADWPVAGETCTHYLTLDNAVYDSDSFSTAMAVMSPPLRSEKHQDALWRSIRSGTLGVVSSDHCPFCLAGQKELGREDFRAIPNGAPGIEHRMILMYGRGVRESRISLPQFVALTSTTPAKTFGMYPRKGSLLPGSDADIVVLDPSGETTITADTQRMRVDYSLWEGWTIPGRIKAVYLRGELAVENGDLLQRQPTGRFVHRAGL
jgi:dihydropyrimidinase